VAVFWIKFLREFEADFLPENLDLLHPPSYKEPPKNPEAEDLVKTKKDSIKTTKDSIKTIKGSIKTTEGSTTKGETMEKFAGSCLPSYTILLKKKTICG
jgi:hypothetical protein